VCQFRRRHHDNAGQHLNACLEAAIWGLRSAMTDLAGIFPRGLLVLRALEERYKGPSFRNELAAEAQWIETVRELFAAEKRRRRGRMSGHLATIAAEGTLQDALAALSVQAAV